MKVTGSVWKFSQDDISTDQIEERFTPLAGGTAGQVLHGDARSWIRRAVTPGDIVVAGRNFGCGSSTPFPALFCRLGSPPSFPNHSAEIFPQQHQRRPAGDHVSGILEIFSTATYGARCSDKSDK